MIRDDEGTAVFIRRDIADPDAMALACREASAAYGRIDILINNAVEFPVESMLEMELGTWDLSMETNLRAPLIAIRELLPAMLERGDGVVANMIGPAGLAFASAMSASKAALRSLVTSLAAEVGGGSDVSVLGFAPGLVATPLVAEVFPLYAARLGLTLKQYVERNRPNPGYEGLQPIEHCAASLVHAIVHASVNHGVIVDPYRALAKAGVIEVPANTASVGEDWPTENAVRRTPENARRLRNHIREIVAQNEELDRKVQRRTQALHRQLAERDATDRALRKSELKAKQLAAIVQSSHDAITVCTPTGRLISWNRAAERMFGYKASEVIGRSISMLSRPDDTGRQHVRLSKILRGERVPAFNGVRVTKGGTELDVSIVLSPVPRDDGTVVAIAASIRDVTEQLRAAERERDLFAAKAAAEAARGKADELERAFQDLARAHDELKSTQEQLRQADKMAAMGQLAGGIAHDFNNMLTAIITYAQFIADDLGKEHPLRGDVDKILEAGDRTRALTHQLLTFSRKDPAVPRVLEIGSVLGEMLTLLTRSLGEDVEIEIDSTHPCWVRIDRSQLEQVILNLAVNARDAMPDGGRLVFRATTKDAVGQSWAVLQIDDSGCGMTAATQARIFEPFFTTKEVGKGTGMGLATVYGIVEQASGTISVRSRLGFGTTFELTFPAAAPAEQPKEVTQDAIPSAGNQEVILLAEDEALVRAATTRVLEKNGYRVFAAADADEALRVMSQHGEDVDLLLADVVMPRMSGAELSAIIRETHPRIRVAYISGYGAETSDPNDVSVPRLQKPFSREALLRLIRRVLDGPSDRDPRSRVTANL